MSRPKSQEEDEESQKALLEQRVQSDGESVTKKAAKAKAEIVWGVVAYAVCSASLLVINKVGF
jgi:hypothetical protein